MSNADPEEMVTASSDGVTVEKSFEPDDFPVPAIAFVVQSDREETVSVRLVDTVPSHVPPEDIGFHPKYGAEFWSVEGDTIVFEREFEAGEEYTTVYGLRGGDADDVEKFMSDPVVEDVDPPLADADAGQTVRDVIGDDGDDEADEDDSETPGMTDLGVEAGSDADEGDASGDLTDDAGDDVVDTSVDLSAAEEAVDATTTEADSGADAAATSHGDGSLVSALTEEIRSGDVDDEEIDELRDALGVDLADASVEARIEHLQSSIADLEAYTEALEEFLDENGDAQQLIEDVRSDFEEATGRFDEIEEIATDAAETAETVDERLDEEFTELETRLDQELETVESRVGDALEDLDDVDRKVEEELEAQLDDELDELWTAVDEASTEAADVAGELRAFRNQVDEEATDRIDELEDEVESLSEELEDVAEMRDRLTSALGGLAPQEAGDDGDDGGDGDDE